jgi:hypothetical protein
MCHAMRLFVLYLTTSVELLLPHDAWCHLHYCSTGTSRLKFRIATRGLLGLKNAMLTATRGMGIMNTVSPAQLLLYQQTP